MIRMKLRQWERILKYLEDFGSITQLEAIRDLGIMRLGARIYDLRKKGFLIIRDTEKSVNRYGEPIRYARYRMAA
jgi:hypothetical protein